MSDTPGKVQALGVEFRADCATNRAKREEGRYSETMALFRKGVYDLYSFSK